MQRSLIEKPQMRHDLEFGASRRSWFVRSGGWVIFLCLVVFTGTLEQGQEPSQSSPNPPVLNSDAVGLASVTPELKQGNADSGKQGVAPATSERKKQLSDDSAKLLVLAIALKAEVDKSSKDTLSLQVIRRADEVEKLARSLKEHMKPAAGAS
jgi:hypothetical protein